MSITGCAICLFKSDNEVFICEENRVVLSYAEQEEMDCKQPFMLPKTTLSVHGTPMEPVHLGRLIHKRMNKLENIDFNVPDDDALELFHQACDNHDRFALSGGRRYTSSRGRRTFPLDRTGFASRM